MSQIATSSASAALIVSLEQNEFDVAGLAEFCGEQGCIDDSLRQLYQIIKRSSEPAPDDRKLLAQVLVSMVSVARNDYAADGHQEYWPFLFGRIRDATFADPKRFWDDTLEGPQYQSLLGRWFLAALEAFDYSVPEEGQKYVGPIVFHAGIPYSALPRLLSVIAAACDQYGSQVVSLPADIRSGLVANHFLHRNVERLLASNLQGATQLWGCLSRVVLAWKTSGDCSQELEQLPLALDPDEVHAALPIESESPRLARTQFPQLRYDPETGEIRLTLSSEASTNWKVTSSNGPVEISWSRTHLGQTAKFLGPLPQEISVEPTNPIAGVGRIFSTHPSRWPGYWFHAHNGNLEDGRTIDASGLAAGRWYVIFEGTPTKCSVPFIGQTPLTWSWFKGNGEWTAWEIDVPARTTSRTHIEWYVDDNCFTVRLGRRPGPRVEFLGGPVVKATTPEGYHLDVFESAPTVVLKRETPITLQLLRETSDSVSVIERLELRPETPTRLPVVQPGVYQLREFRGVGRSLLRFAIVPGLQIEGPRFDVSDLIASVAIRAHMDSGQICCDEDTDVRNDGRAWVIQSPTVEPFLKARWCWANANIPVLAFRWPVEALRWRVTHAEKEYAEWTREPIFISPKTVSEHDAQLEIQLPVGTEVAINGETYLGRLQAGPSGNTIVHSLLSYGETVELQYEGQRYAAVLKSERPILKSLNGATDSESLVVLWKAIGPKSGIVMVAWNPCDPLSAPKTFMLSETERAADACERTCAELPGTEWTAISLARSASGFFQKFLHLAALHSAAMEPASLLLNRSTGEIKSYSDQPSGWVEFLHHITLMRLARKELGADSLNRWVEAIDKQKDFELEAAITLIRDLRYLLENKVTNDVDRRWAESVIRPLLGIAHRQIRGNPACALKNSDANNWFNLLLTLGIPIGQLYPSIWVKTTTLPHESCLYPFGYIRDLWLLGTIRKCFEQQIGAALPPNFEEMQVSAAKSVLLFHEENGMPPLSAFLPLGRGIATIEKTDQGHRHSFALPPLPKLISSVSDLCELLGLKNKAIDCQATSDDQFFDDRHRGNNSRSLRGTSSGRPSHQTAGYSLYWCAGENRWAIETLNSSSPTCCYTNGEPLIVAAIQPVDLANSVLRDVLNKWANDEPSPSGLEKDFGFLDGCRNALIADPVVGPLHAELFKRSEIASKELFGRRIQVETKSSLSQCAIIAWQLAWIERVSAWEGTRHEFEREGENNIGQRDFLRGLGRALTLWPNLMRRTIALAELVYWTIYRGGVGTAVRFRCQQTDHQLAILRQNAFVQERPNQRVSANLAPAAKHVESVSGVIVGYNAGVGIVLLQLPSSPSLDATVSDFVNNRHADQFWRASFNWSNLSIEVRDQLKQLFEKRCKTSPPKYPLSLADVMRGLRVTCELKKQPEWEAVKVDVDFGKGRIHLPKHRWLKPKTEK